MLGEFIKDAQKFSIKKSVEALKPDEAIVKFKDSRGIQTFFNDAMKNKMNSDSIQRMAGSIAPSYIRRSLKSPPPLSERERLDFLFSEIAKGNANVVLRNDTFYLEPKKSSPPPPKDEEKGFFKNIDFAKIAERQVNHLKKIYSKMVHTGYSMLEKVYHYDENSTGPVPGVVDTSSVQKHSTGWKSWDNPFEIASLGAFKAAFTYSAGAFLKLSASIKAAAIVGSQTELVSAQYSVTAKTVVTKKWYGSYAMRFNFLTLTIEIPWIKFDGCGPEEKRIVELKRKDRLVFHNKPIYNHPEVIIPPSISMDKYLADYKNSFSLPEHDVNKPIKVSVFDWV